MYVHTMEERRHDGIDDSNTVVVAASRTVCVMVIEILSPPSVLPTLKFRFPQVLTVL